VKPESHNAKNKIHFTCPRQERRYIEKEMALALSSGGKKMEKDIRFWPEKKRKIRYSPLWMRREQRERGKIQKKKRGY